MLSSRLQFPVYRQVQEIKGAKGMLSSADILQIADVVHQVVLFLFIGLPMAKPIEKWRPSTVQQ